MTTIRLLLLFVAGLGTAAVDVRDIDGVSRHVLSPAANQLDLLFFISADCPISNRYAPEIQRVCNDYRSRAVRCFTVYPEALETSAVKRHRQDYRFDPSIPAVIDRDHRLVRAVGPRVTPEAALYSSSGRLYRGRIDDLYVDVGRSRSAPTRRDLRMAIDAAIAGKPIEAAETEAVGCFIQTP